MDKNLERIYETAVRGDVSALLEVSFFIRRGSFSFEQCVCLEAGFKKAKEDLELASQTFEWALQETRNQGLSWARGEKYWHFLFELRITGQKFGYCEERPEVKTLEHSINRNPDLKHRVGLPWVQASSERVPESALWILDETKPDGVPICRECKRRLYDRNRPAFFSLREFFKDKKLPF